MDFYGNFDLGSDISPNTVFPVEFDINERPILIWRNFLRNFRFRNEFQQIKGLLGQFDNNEKPSQFDVTFHEIFDLEVSFAK